MFIRKSRYTFEFLEREGKYTLSFYDTTKYRETMLMLGTKSGRDSEKIKESGLTPLKMPHGSMAFAEADMIIECAILQHQQFDPATIRSEEVLKMFPFYLDKKDPDCHYIFFGEILNVWKKDKK